MGFIGENGISVFHDMTMPRGSDDNLDTTVIVILQMGHKQSHHIKINIKHIYTAENSPGPQGHTVSYENLGLYSRSIHLLTCLQHQIPLLN